MSDLLSPHRHQHLEMSLFFILAILIGVLWYIIVVLIYITLMTNDVGYLFMWLFAISLSSLVKCLFMSFTHVLIGSFTFLLLSFCKFFIFPISSLLEIRYANIFFHHVTCLFNPLTRHFSRGKAFNSDEVQLINFSFHVLWFWCQI